jgi:hypothetical protein
MLMTKLREEEERKKKSQKAAEIIKTIGEKGQKGRKAAKEFFKEKDGEANKERDEELSLLDSTGNITTYNTLLAKLLMKRMRFVDFPKGWSVKIAPTKKGVVMELRSPDDKFFRSGFVPVMDPFYDLNAVDVYAIRAENTIDRMTGADKVVSSGIHLPNEKERQIN